MHVSHLLAPQFARCADEAAVARVALGQALAVAGTRLGNVQFADWRQPAALSIVAQQGFGDEFMNCFRTVAISDPSACGRALLTRDAVVIDDVFDDPSFERFRAVALRAGFRSVQSTPLLTERGALLGVLSTHSPTAGRPSPHQLEMLRMIAREAASALVRLRMRDVPTDVRPNLQPAGGPRPSPDTLGQAAASR